MSSSRDTFEEPPYCNPVIEAYKRHVDLGALRRNLRLTPEERLLRMMDLARLAEELHRAGPKPPRKS